MSELRRCVLQQLLVAVNASRKLEVREVVPAAAQEQLQEFEARLAATKLRCAVEPTRWVVPTVLPKL